MHSNRIMGNSFAKCRKRPKITGTLRSIITWRWRSQVASRWTQIAATARARHGSGPSIGSRSWKGTWRGCWPRGHCRLGKENAWSGGHRCRLRSDRRRWLTNFSQWGRCCCRRRFSCCLRPNSRRTFPFASAFLKFVDRFLYRRPTLTRHWNSSEQIFSVSVISVRSLKTEAYSCIK